MSEIPGDAMGHTTRLRNRFASCLGRISVTVASDLRSGIGECDGDSSAQTCRSPSDESDPLVESE